MSRGEGSRPRDIVQGPEGCAAGRVSGTVGWRVREDIRAAALNPSKHVRF